MSDTDIRYSDELERLIAMAIVDGEISTTERRLLIRRAAEEGIDPEEFELAIQSRLYEKNMKAIQHGNVLDVKGKRMVLSTEKLAAQLAATKSRGKRADIINDFPLPSTAEDLLEFMVTMSTKAKGMRGELKEEDEAEKRAYISKYDEASLKARTFFPDDARFQRVLATTKLSKKDRMIKESDITQYLKVIAAVLGIYALLFFVFYLLSR